MRPTTPARPTRRRRTLAAALLLAVLAAGCGVETSSDALDTKGKGGTTTTTDPEVPCGDDHDGDVVGAPGSSVSCLPDPDPKPQPDPKPEPDPKPKPKPDPEPSGDEAAYLEALAIGLEALEDDDLPVTEDQASCIAPEWIDAIGVETLVDAGISPEDLEDFDLDEVFADAVDRDTADAMITTVVDCGIDLEEFVRQDGLSDGQTEDQMDCFFDALPAGAIEALLAATLDQGDDFDPDDPAIVALGEAYEGCLVTDSSTTTTGG